MPTILLTGADGFLGRGVRAAFERGGRVFRPLVRASTRPDEVAVGDIAQFAKWPEVLAGVDSILHLAARAHVRATGAAAQVEAFRPTNLDATLRLAEAAIAQGVRRFVFVSSIGVNGNETRGMPFSEADRPAPVDPYAISKWEAEQSLVRMSSRGPMELVIVRPTLVYGPGVKGNLARLLALVNSGIPVPLGALRAPRSFIGRENLADLLIACIDHPAAAGQTFVAAEPQRQSTASFVRAIAAKLGRSNRIWTVPSSLLRAAATLAGRRADLEKLGGALEVDPSKAMRHLGWQPRVSFEAGIGSMVDSFLAARGGA